MRQLITIVQAMEILQLGRTKINEIIATDPTFPAYMIGRRIKVDLEKLDAWIESQKTSAVVVPVIQAKRGRPPQSSQPAVKRVYEVITPGWNKAQ